MTKKAIIFALVAALAWMVGCDKPPEVQMTSARQAEKTAQGAEVGKYAPEELSKMQDSLKAGLAEL